MEVTMNFGDTEIMRSKVNLRLLKIGCKDDKIAYCVLGNGPTLHYDDYEDALDEFNLRWMKMLYGNQTTN